MSFMTRLNILFFFLAAIYCGIVYHLHPDRTMIYYIESYGTVVQILLPAYCAVPILAKKDYRGAYYFLLYFVINIVLVYILKYTVPEKRPTGGAHSFPSGHTTAAFIGVMFLFRRYGWKYLFVSLPFALAVAISRILSQRHWPIDVVTAMVISIALGFLIVRPYSKNQAKLF